MPTGYATNELTPGDSLVFDEAGLATETAADEEVAFYYNKIAMTYARTGDGGPDIPTPPPSTDGGTDDDPDADGAAMPEDRWKSPADDFLLDGF